MRSARRAPAARHLRRAARCARAARRRRSEAKAAVGAAARMRGVPWRSCRGWGRRGAAKGATARPRWTSSSTSRQATARRVVGAARRRCAVARPLYCAPARVTAAIAGSGDARPRTWRTPAGLPATVARVHARAHGSSATVERGAVDTSTDAPRSRGLRRELLRRDARPRCARSGLRGGTGVVPNRRPRVGASGRRVEDPRLLTRTTVPPPAVPARGSRESTGGATQGLARRLRRRRPIGPPPFRRRPARQARPVRVRARRSAVQTSHRSSRARGRPSPQNGRRSQGR